MCGSEPHISTAHRACCLRPSPAAASRDCCLQGLLPPGTAASRDCCLETLTTHSNNRCSRSTGMARTEKIRASPFTSEELEVLVDGVLAQYPRLYGGPNVVLKVHQRKAVWRAIAAEVRALGVSNRRRTHCHKRWDDISRLAKNVAEMTLGQIPRTGRLARRSFTPLMGRILAVTHPELDARLKEHQQHGRASPVDTVEHDTCTSGGETSTNAAQEPSETDLTSASEGDRSILEESRPETQSTTSSDASGDADMLVGTGNGESASSPTTQRPVPSLPSTASGAARVRARRRGRVTFTAGTAAPAPVPPAAISAESIELLRQLCVGQTALLNAFIEHDKKLGQVIAYMEGIHSDVGGLHRTVQAFSGTVTSALEHANTQIPAQVPLSTPQVVATSEDSDHVSEASQSRYSTRSTQKKHTKRASPQTTSTQSKAPALVKDKSPSGKGKGGSPKEATSGKHGSVSSPAKDTPVPSTSRKARHPVSVLTEEGLSDKGTPRKDSEPVPQTTSTPIPSPVKQGKESTVGGSPVEKGKGAQKRGRTKRPAASSTSPEGVPVSAPVAAQLVCVPVVSLPVPINPKTGKPFRIPKKWKGTPPTSPTHTVSVVSMSPPPRATTPPGPNSPPSCQATGSPTSPVPLSQQSGGPAVPETQPAPSPHDPQV